MKAFVECGSILRALAGCVSLLICLTSSCNFVLSWKQRNRLYFAYAFLLEICGMFMLQTCRRVADWSMAGKLLRADAWFTGIPALTSFLAGLPILAWILVSMVLLAFSGWLTVGNLCWRKKHITPLSIQESFEKLTDGLCYYRTGGQCVLVNGRMHEICRELTGHSLLNGEEFTNLLQNLGDDSDKLLEDNNGRMILVTLQDKSTVSFSVGEIDFYGETLREMIAVDVTELYAKTERLRKENVRLRIFQKELREYNSAIQETVRREEILRAKMNIHDEMNRLLLFSRKVALTGDDGEKKEALFTWKQNALLLCKETEGYAEQKSIVANVLRDLRMIADSMGIELVCIGNPEHITQEVARLFVFATREALNNAVKHAGAKHLYVKLEEDSGGLVVEYQNDFSATGPEGIWNKERNGQPIGEITENGGLRNLRQKIEQAGGKMEVRNENGFVLRLEMPY